MLNIKKIVYLFLVSLILVGNSRILSQSIWFTNPTEGLTVSNVDYSDKVKVTVTFDARATESQYHQAG